MSRLGRGRPVQNVYRPPYQPRPAIVYDATGAGNTGTGTSKSLSWSHTINGAAVCWLSLYSTSSSSTATAEVGTTSMPQLASVQFYAASGLYGWLIAFGLIGGPTGPQTVSVSVTGGTNYLAADSVSYTGVTSFGTPVTNSGATTSASVSASAAANQMVAAAFSSYAQSGSTTITAFNQTSRYNVPFGSGVNLPLVVGDAPGAATVNFAATAPTNKGFGGIAIPLL